jgi:K+ transporter
MRCQCFEHPNIGSHAPFFSANLLTIGQGGWFPLVIGLVMSAIMTTWGHGWEMMLDEARLRGKRLGRAGPRFARAWGMM